MLRRPTLFLATATALAGFFTASCSPVKGYSGPDLPDTQLALIGYRFNSDEVDIDRATANQIEFFSSGIKLLPGHADLSLRIQTKEPPVNCVEYPNFDSYGYNDCRDDARKASEKGDTPKSCDCFDYLSIHQRCSQTVHDANCSATAALSQGRRYRLQVYKSSAGAGVTIEEEGAPKPVGYGSCQMLGTSERTIENSLGSGRYTANQYGFYSCR